MANVIYNEKYVGEIEKRAVDSFIMKLKNERRDGKLPYFLSVYYDEQCDEIVIDTTVGRALRPLIVIENGQSKLTKDIYEKFEKGEIKWADLVNRGIIEYLDAAEEENALVALNEKEITNKSTHLEVSPIGFMGIVSSLISFANYGQMARLNRGQKTIKQSIGLYASNFHLRMDTDLSMLHYPQTPIVRTQIADIIQYDKHPSGTNIVVALLSYQGYNMSDAVIINKGSIDRGFARSTYFRPYNSEEIKYPGGLSDRIEVPDKEVAGYKSESSYSLLEDDGIILQDADVSEGRVLIGKVAPPRFLGESSFDLMNTMKREASSYLKQGEEGVVDMVVITKNGEGNKMVNVRLRQSMVPEIGDKFASRYGQKGVIGLIIPQEDMPFTFSGITPDLIFSPHSIPSRMTFSHLFEALAGKLGALAGRYIDGTPFMNEDELDLRNELKNYGFKENGNELMIDGKTGKMYNVEIYVGSMYYFRLKHLVAKKLQSRAVGKVQLLTKQPVEGRAKGGGLRLGEMEKDCFVAHGASLLLKERFSSDRTIIPVCKSCGSIADYNEYLGLSKCPRCGESIDIDEVEVAYAFKLLMDEIKAMHIEPKLRTKLKFERN